MKLLYITNVYIPGMWAHSLQVMKMCEAFSKNGLEVELATGMKKDQEDKIFLYYNIKTKFKITKIPYLDLSSQGSSKINFLLRTLSFLLFTRLYVIFKKPDILYFRTLMAGLFFSNYYIEVHELPPRLNRWHKITLKKAKKIVVLNTFLKEELINRGAEKEKIIIAPDAVDLEEFQIKMSLLEVRQKLSLPADKKIIMYGGNFRAHNWKGVDILLESLKYLDDIICVLVGGQESEFSKIKELYHNQRDNIILVGHQPHKKMPDYFKAADVLVLPNKKGNVTSEYYTSPLKLFEYMASGRPIVASSLPSIREVLNKTNAVLVKPNNPKDLARGIKKVFQDEILAKKITEQSLVDVNNYTWQKRAESII